MEEAERFDPSGLERLELAIAMLVSTVQGILGKPQPPGEIVADWGGLRAKARAEAEANTDLLELARRRNGAL